MSSRVKPSRRWPVVPHMTDDPDALRIRLDRLDELVKSARFSQGDDHARMERSIQLVIRALQLVAQSRQQTGNVVRQSEVAEVAAHCRRIVEAARREGLRIGDNDNLG